MIRLKFFFITLGSFLVIACSNGDKFDPSNYLSANEKNEFIFKIVRYTAKAPEGVDSKRIFDTKYDNYYLDKASRLRLERYYQRADIIYFLISQPAPSLTEKRTATAGTIQLASDGRILRYEEVFRTWKLIPDTLARRSYLLFDKMVGGESLEPFYAKNKADEYIEFPDDKVFYNVENRKWELQPLRDSASQ